MYRPTINELGVLHEVDEQACEAALEKHESARTRVGRFLSEKVLEWRRLQLENSQEAYETALEIASMHGQAAADSAQTIVQEQAAE